MLDTVIFDMDGLLIDSEPLWQKAGIRTLRRYGIDLTVEQYLQSTGLRTSEWIDWWFTRFGIDKNHAAAAIHEIQDGAIDFIRREASPFPGTHHILDFFKERHFAIGLATSSPVKLIEVVVDKLHIRHYFKGWSSAEYLTYGKPHPQVFLDCAGALGADPMRCLCFEDSFNGMIAAKAAKMKCVVVPAAVESDHVKWHAADLKLSSLADFTEEHLEALQRQS